MTLTRAEVEPLLDRMAGWVSRAYPSEACGLIVKDESGALAVVCCENQQDALHAVDPVRYPRTARTAYSLDARAWLRVEDEGASVRGVFHSHPDRGAYFSEEDVLGALGGDPDGDPILADVDYVVLAATAGGVHDFEIYGWSATNRCFEERR